MSEQFLSFAISTAQKAGQKLLEHFGESPPITRGTPKEVKSLFDDIADKIIREEIERVYPEHSYVTEETGRVEKDSDHVWIIDPLDGTGNYVNSNPFFAVSISLWVKDHPLVAVIEAPALKERYIAERGKGAFVIDLESDERQPAGVSQTKDLSKAYLAFCEGGIEDRNAVVQTFQKLYSQVKDMRKLGSAALEMAWVGLGRADAYITHQISLWDIAAGVLFVSEAGGRVLDFEGKEFPFEKMAQLSELDVVAINHHLELPSL